MEGFGADGYMRAFVHCLKVTHSSSSLSFDYGMHELLSFLRFVLFMTAVAGPDLSSLLHCCFSVKHDSINNVTLTSSAPMLPKHVQIIK